MGRHGKGGPRYSFGTASRDDGSMYSQSAPGNASPGPATYNTRTPDFEGGKSFTRDGNLQPEIEDQSEDLIILANGDRLSGLVLDLTNSVEVERADTSVVSVPLERVDYVSLVNPVAKDSGVRAWLTRGDEVKISDFPFDAGTGLRIPGREPLMPTYLYAIAFDAARVSPLADAPSRTSAIPGAPRYVTPDPEIKSGAWPLDAPPIGLMGPMRTEWLLPEAGMGLTTTLVLPSRYREHGDFDLVMFDGPDEIRSIRMNARNPRVAITVRLRTRSLAIEIREADSGPMQDYVRLERALLIHPRENDDR